MQLITNLDYLEADSNELVSHNNSQVYIYSICSMKIGLSVCAVLLLDPFEFFDVNVKQPKPDIMMPHEVFDGLQDEMPRPKKVGRKPIRRDIMTVYFNHPSFSIIIPPRSIRGSRQARIYPNDVES